MAKELLDFTGVDYQNRGNVLNAPFYAFNAYYDGANWKYKSTDFAMLIEYVKSTGIYTIKTAPSGSVDANITWTVRQVVTSTGSVGIGGTPISEKFEVLSGYIKANAGGLVGYGVGGNQLLFGYDASNRVLMSVASDGSHTWSFSGSGAKINIVGASFGKAVRGSQTALTSTSNSIAIDFEVSNDFLHTFTENTTLANPSNVVVGQSGSIFLTQHASSPKTLAFGSNWDFVGGTVPVVSATNSTRDRLDYIVRSATQIEVSLSKAWS